MYLSDTPVTAALGHSCVYAKVIDPMMMILRFLFKMLQVFFPFLKGAAGKKYVEKREKMNYGL